MIAWASEGAGHTLSPPACYAEPATLPLAPVPEAGQRHRHFTERITARILHRIDTARADQFSELLDRI